MVTSFLAWWIARIIELLPFLAGGGAPDGVVVDVDASGTETASLRRKGREAVITMKAAARRARRRVTLLRPPSNTILQTRRILPTASRRDTKQMLRHLLGRITPFSADALFWSWEGRLLPLDRTRTEVTLTMVPKMAVAPALDRLATAGIRPHFLEVGDPARPRLLPIQESGTAGSIQRQLVHGLAYTCVGLTGAVLLLPFGRQALALHNVNSAIAELQPAVAQAEALGRSIIAGGTGNEILTQEMRQTGDVLQVLEMVTRDLPDDTYLTDFVLRSLHLSISGRSASAPRLIGGLSADRAIREVAFAAPVTRPLDGTSADVFSIQGEILP